MAETARAFNVWIVQSNMVYRAVPYSVVCDWIQEGRLTGKDCVRTADEKNWKYISDHELFRAYLDMPAATPGAEDDADALADIEMDFVVKKAEEEGDEDPDMIPLIDISMVLLVFFMMTAQDLMTQSPVDSPKAGFTNITDNKSAVMVNIMRDRDDPNKLLYYFGDDFKVELTEDTVTDRARDEMAQRSGVPIVIIRADSNLPFEKVQSLQIALQLKIPNVKIQGQVKGKQGEDQ